MHQRYDAQRQSIIDSVRSNHPLGVSTLIILLWWCSSTISYSSCIPSHSFWHQRCCHCFVGWPASSYLTNPGKSTPSCPYASGFSCCVHPIFQVFGRTRGVAQRKDGPLYLTLSVWVGDHRTKDTWVSTINTLQGIHRLNCISSWTPSSSSRLSSGQSPMRSHCTYRHPLRSLMPYSQHRHHRLPSHLQGPPWKMKQQNAVITNRHGS